MLLGLALGYFVDPHWLLLVAFVGVNLLQSSITGFCPLTKILVRLGVKPCQTGSPLS